jgi:hypothetical protein
MSTIALPEPSVASRPSGRLQFSLARNEDRAAIYRMRHDVYARELGQHRTNEAGELHDALDAFNIYIIARRGDQFAGFVSITPPGHGRYSVDKYLTRDELPFPCDAGLYEVRLLTVAPAFRGRGPLAYLLMHAALRYIESRGGTRIVAIGRREVLPVYRKAGLRSLGREIVCGQVRFDLLTATVDSVRQGP